MKWIDKRYGNVSYEIKQKLVPLFVILVILTVLSTMLMVSNLLGHQDTVTFIAHGFLWAAILTALIALMRGHFVMTSRLFFTFIFCLMAALRLVNGYSDPSSMAMVVSILGSFLIMSSVFISSFRLIAILAGIGTVTYGYVHISAFFSADMQNGLLTIDKTMYPFISQVAIVVAVLVTRRIFDKVLARTNRNLEQMEKQSERGKKLVLSSMEQMNKSEVLLENTQETASAVVQIERNLNSIKESVAGLDGNIRSSVDIIDELTGSVSEIRGTLSEQSTQVTASSIAISSIVDNIRSVEDIITREELSVSNLKNKSRAGEDIVSEAMRSFTNVTAQIDNIRGITTMISKIAAQTNLLAMNAAIEAAHAGEAGKGFAVVAEEIRKLAEETNENSRLIRETLEKNNEQVQKSVASTDELHGIFSAVSENTEQVRMVMEETIAAMQELNAGTKSITEAVSNLLESKTRVSDALGNMDRSTESGVSSIEQIADAAEDVSEQIDNLAELVQTILDQSRELNRIGEENVKNFLDLQSSLDNIKLKSNEK